MVAGAVLGLQCVELDGQLIEPPAHFIQTLFGGVAGSYRLAYLAQHNTTVTVANGSHYY